MYSKILVSFTAIGLVAFVFVFPFQVFAESVLPDMMVGQTTVVSGGNTYYGGMTGNYAIFNGEPNSSYGFDTTRLTDDDCGILINASPVCFIIGTGSNGTGGNISSSTRLMTSRTTVGGTVMYELPALFLGGINVIGDTYSTDYSNFTYWGKALAQSRNSITPNGSNGETWGMGSYNIDSKSMAYWNGKDDDANVAKINTLKGEGADIDLTNLAAISTGPWELQKKTISLPSSADETFKYPEGKVWTVDGDVVINSSSIAPNLKNIEKNYSGQGIIIVNGNMRFRTGSKILPTSSTAALGFIVYGDVTIEAGCEIKAPIMAIKSSAYGAGGTIKIYNNNKLTGFYIANSFDFPVKNNIQILYDTKLDSLQPPGFRNISGLSSGEVGNTN
ncbi:MAG: hypothetical protein WCG48_01050 [Candidatus Berkelbacteria bacterium]